MTLGLSPLYSLLLTLLPEITNTSMNNFSKEELVQAASYTAPRLVQNPHRSPLISTLILEARINP